MDFLSYIPATTGPNRLVYRPFYPQEVAPPVVVTDIPGGTSRRDRRRKKVTRYSDVELQTTEIAVAPLPPLERAADKITRASYEAEGAIEDDELFMLALMRILN